MQSPQDESSENWCWLLLCCPGLLCVWFCWFATGGRIVNICQNPWSYLLLFKFHIRKHIHHYQRRVLANFKFTPCYPKISILVKLNSLYQMVKLKTSKCLLWTHLLQGKYNIHYKTHFPSSSGIWAITLVLMQVQNFFFSILEYNKLSKSFFLEFLHEKHENSYLNPLSPSKISTAIFDV